MFRAKELPVQSIDDALQELAQGNTEKAKAIFLEIENNKVKEGRTAYQEAATAARKRGELAFLTNIDEALAAYHRAVELDPENPDGWNQLGQLLHRTGQLQEAETGVPGENTKNVALRNFIHPKAPIREKASKVAV